MKPGEDEKAYIDRVCGQILDMVNHEADDDFDPVLFLAGQLLAISTFMETATACVGKPPAEFQTLHDDVDRCLGAIAVMLIAEKARDTAKEPVN